MTALLTIDPGRSSGAVLGAYSETEPWAPVAVWQVPNGAQGFIEWWGCAKKTGLFNPAELEVVAEKFVPYPTPGHSPTLDSSYPLVVEGVLIALGLMPDQYPHPAWQRSSEQYPNGGRTKAEKKKLRQQWLKEHGLWQTGKDVGQADADDANSAIAHSLVAMRKKRHEPTLRRYWPEDLED